MFEIVIIFLLLVIIAGVYRPKTTKTTLIGKKRSVILDSCTLIDGRVIDLARLGFINDHLIVPNFIVAELQLLADGHDSQKRERARFGLDVIKQLQAMRDIDISVDDWDLGKEDPTDNRLIAMALKLKALLFTTDFNLSKVAEIAGVVVLNVNDLTQSLRPIVLPGERTQIKLLQKGSNQNQGVGYLEDGTMIVVENGYSSIGKQVEVEISRVHQTVAGKMLFGQIVGSTQPTSSRGNLHNTPALAGQPKSSEKNFRNRFRRKG